MDKRKILFKSFVGFENENLGKDPDKRKIYKIYITPTFNDLYMNLKIDRTEKEKRNNKLDKDFKYFYNEYHYCDIRIMLENCYNTNPLNLEELFSKKIEIGTEIKSSTIDNINKLFNIKDDISKMNLPYFYDSAILNYNINRKNASHNNKKFNLYMTEAIRNLDLLRRFANNNFNDFKSALVYSNNDDFRKTLLDIKNKEIINDKIINIADVLYSEITSNYKVAYKKQNINNDLKMEILNLSKQIIKNELL